VQSQADKGKTTNVCKRAAALKRTGNEQRKKCKPSAGEGMTAIASSVETSIDSLVGMVAGARQHTPQSVALELESRTMKSIEKNEGLLDEDLDIAAMVMANHPACVNMYLSLKKKGSRTSYLLREMENLRGPSNITKKMYFW
jgi:hypothetical protein